MPLFKVRKDISRDVEEIKVTNLVRLELDISTGKLLFEWSSLDHVAPDGR